jgi:hypothetical protein
MQCRRISYLLTSIGGITAIATGIASSGCGGAHVPHPQVAQKARVHVPQLPPSPTYQKLDGRFHYYAVTSIEPLEDHFRATYFDVEGATHS